MVWLLVLVAGARTLVLGLSSSVGPAKRCLGMGFGGIWAFGRPLVAGCGSASWRYVQRCPPTVCQLSEWGRILSKGGCRDRFRSE